MYCKKCGNILNDKNNFCPQCGTLCNGNYINNTLSQNHRKIILNVMMFAFIICVVIILFFNKRQNKIEFLSNKNVFINEQGETFAPGNIELIYSKDKCQNVIPYIIADDNHTLYCIYSDLKPEKICEEVYVLRTSYSGNVIAFLTELNDDRNAGTLYLYDTKKKKSVKLDEDVYIGYICMSPDGKTVSYVKDYKSCTNNKLYMAQWGNIPVQIESGGCFPIAVSNKGKSLYYFNAYNQMDMQLFLRHNNETKLLDEGINISCFYANNKISELLYAKNGEMYFYSQKKDVVMPANVSMGEMEETKEKRILTCVSVAKIIESSNLEGCIYTVNKQLYILDSNGQFEKYDGSIDILYHSEVNYKEPQLKSIEYTPFILEEGPDTYYASKSEYDEKGRLIYKWLEDNYEESYVYSDAGYTLCKESYLYKFDNLVKQNIIYKMEENRIVIFIYDENDQFVECTILEKDCFGNKISEYTYDDKGIYVSKVISKYNKLNLLLKENTYNRQMQLVNSVENDYREDSEGNYIMNSYINNQLIAQNKKYDGKGNLIGEGDIDKEGNIGTYYIEYEKGNCVKEYYGDILNLYERDEEGNLLKWYQGDRNGDNLVLQKENEYEYEYDEHRNVVCVKCYALYWAACNNTNESIEENTQLEHIFSYTYY